MMYLSKGIYEEASLAMKARWEFGEKILLRSGTPEYIIKYAADVIRGRWIEGEKRLLDYCADHPDSARFIYLYAEQVIKGRWIEAEPTMLNSIGPASVGSVLDYVQTMVKGRWLELEPHLAGLGNAMSEYVIIVVENDRAFKNYKSYLIDDFRDKVKADCYRFVAQLNGGSQRYV